ncbi:MAG: recombination protein RecT [Planctomycetia bacterium]
MSKGLSTVKDKAANVRGLIERCRGQIAMALPKHMTPERMMRVCNTAIQKTPALLDCEPRSLMGAIIQSSQLGLEPDGVLGHAYLIPFNNRKTGRIECQFIAGYKGLIELSRRSGQISTVYAHAVHANDEFRYTLGLDPTLIHKPTSGEPGDLIAVYAVCHLRDGGKQFEVLQRREIDAIRSQSKASNSGPWVTHYDEMAKKTALRRLCKLLPTSPELARAAALDELAEASQPQDLGFLAPAEIPGDDSATVVDAESDDQDRGDADDSLPAGVQDAVSQMKAGAAKARGSKAE